jgi:hypothetical protein
MTALRFRPDDDNFFMEVLMSKIACASTLSDTGFLSF